MTTLATTLEVEQVQCDYEQVESWLVPVSSAAKKCSTSSSPEDSRSSNSAPSVPRLLSQTTDAVMLVMLVAPTTCFDLCHAASLMLR